MFPDISPYRDTERLSMYYRKGYYEALCWIAPEWPPGVPHNRSEYLAGYKRGIKTKVKMKRKKRNDKI